MPISKLIFKEGLQLSHHEVNQLSVAHTPLGPRVNVVVVSYADAQARAEGAAPLAWVYGTVDGIADMLDLASTEAALVVAGELEGGVVVAQPVLLSDIELARLRRWEAIKVERARAASDPIVSPWGTFDADPASQDKIIKRVLMINNLPAASLPATLKFTRSDNTDAVMTPAEMVQLGLLLGQQVEAAYETGRVLRAQIAAATTVEEVAAVAWPAI